jgi:hypothetical protein
LFWLLSHIITRPDDKSIRRLGFSGYVSCSVTVFLKKVVETLSSGHAYWRKVTDGHNWIIAEKLYPIQIKRPENLPRRRSKGSSLESEIDMPFTPSIVRKVSRVELGRK